MSPVAAANPAIDYHALAPALVMAGTAFVVLVLDLFLRPGRKHLAMPVAFLGAAGTLAAALTLAGSHRATFGGSYVMDGFSVLFDVLFSGVAMAVLALSYRYVRDGSFYQGEYYFLLLCSFLGMITISSSRDLLLLFLSLELVSAPAFLLAGFRRRDLRSNEAALKFFLIGVVSSAVMLYGMSLVYGLTGTTRFAGIAHALAGPAGRSALAQAAILLVVAGFAFKVSAFPFQFWAPDTYEGAPVPVAAFLSVASKAAGFAGLLPLMFVAFAPRAATWAPVFAVVSLATMFLGNLVAIQQRQLVRMLAYSSIAQAGYMLLPFALAGRSAAVDRQAFAAVVLYVMIYAVMNLGAFAVAVGVAAERPDLRVADFAGLGRRAPAMAVAMTAFLVSLAGIPPLAGFWGKLFVFSAAVRAGGDGPWLAVAMVVNSVISLVYYLAVVRPMWSEGGEGRPVEQARIPRLAAGVAVLALAGVLVVGVLPDLFAHFAPFAALTGR